MAPLLDPDDLDPTLFAPVDEGARYEFQSIICPYLSRQTSLNFELLHHANQAVIWQRRIDLIRETLPSQLVEVVTYSEPFAVVERVTHKIDGPFRVHS